MFPHTELVEILVLFERLEKPINKKAEPDKKNQLLPNDVVVPSTSSSSTVDTEQIPA